MGARCAPAEGILYLSMTSTARHRDTLVPWLTLSACTKTLHSQMPNTEHVPHQHSTSYLSAGQ